LAAKFRRAERQAVKDAGLARAAARSAKPILDGRRGSAKSLPRGNGEV
jgi:hypothetical protein